MLDPTQLNTLAMNMDPAPLLQQAGNPMAAGGASVMAPPAYSSPYSSMIMPGEQSTPQPAAPLDPRSLMMLSSMMQPGQPHYMPPAQVARPAPFNLAIPQIPTGGQHRPVGTLSQYVGGK